MTKLRLLNGLTNYAWKRICQQFLLLAVLSMLFLLLSMAAPPVAEGLLTQGVAFSGLSFGVCAPEGDSTARLLEELTGRMQDVSRYAVFREMDRCQAEAALEAGEITGILVLPEDFIGGVLGGRNPDVLLIVSREKPLEALLSYWVGQSAADLLTASQQGIYAVLDLVPPERWDQAMADINLRYISTALNRQELFRLRELQAVDSMDLGIHYSLSLLVFLVMASAPALESLFDDASSPMRRRLLRLGHGAVLQYVSCYGVSCCVIFLVTALPVLLGGSSLPGALLLALFGGGFAGVCCLLTRSASGCGGIAVPTAAVAVFLSGGVLPAPLLPPLVAQIGRFSPVAALRAMLYKPSGPMLGLSLLWTGLLFGAGLLLYRRALRKEDGE